MLKENYWARHSALFFLTDGLCDANKNMQKNELVEYFFAGKSANFEHLPTMPATNEQSTDEEEFKERNETAGLIFEADVFHRHYFAQKKFLFSGTFFPAKSPVNFFQKAKIPSNFRASKVNLACQLLLNLFRQKSLLFQKSIIFLINAIAGGSFLGGLCRKQGRLFGIINRFTPGSADWSSHVCFLWK